MDRTLAEEMRKDIGMKKAVNGGKIKRVEKAGASIEAGLKKGDPFHQGGCPYEDKCYIGEDGD